MNRFLNFIKLDSTMLVHIKTISSLPYMPCLFAFTVDIHLCYLFFTAVAKMRSLSESEDAFKINLRGIVFYTKNKDMSTTNKG